jgi:glucosamine--fructose-6-phosphate aminotransferase (isomerizing)
MALQQSFLYQEIHEQPEILNRLLTWEKEVIQQLAKAIKQRDVSHIVIAARGTSDNAGRYAQYLLGAVNGLMVSLATPSLFSIYEQPPRFGNALVLGISQSGRSPDIVAVLAEARRQGALTAAGVERSIAATKTYTSQLAAIALLSATLAQNAEMLRALEQIPDTVTTTLGMETEISRVTERYRYMRDCVVIGRGYNYATAFELALKLKELTYTIAEPYSSADFLHGPLALIEHGFPAIVIAPSGVMLPEIQDFIHTLKQREAEVITISDDKDTLALARIPLKLPGTVPEWLSPITTIIPGQLFAMHLAYVRDYDPDHPRGLRKVTETR